MKLQLHKYGDCISYSFVCPGCNDSHTFRTGPGGWTFNGDLDSPTIEPSLLVTSGHYLVDHKPGDSCWCTFNAERPDNPAPFQCHRCHSYVREGKIQFLSDCSHKLAGQTVDLPNVEKGADEN